MKYINHRSGGSSRLIVNLLFGVVVVSAPSARHAVCAPVSERCVRCFVLLSFLLCRFVFWAPPSHASLAPPILLRRQFCLLLHLSIAQCCWPYRLDESGLAAYCPCQLKTGLVSPRRIHMSIVYTPLFTSILINVPSRIFRIC